MKFLMAFCFILFMITNIDAQINYDTLHYVKKEKDKDKDKKL